MLSIYNILAAIVIVLNLRKFDFLSLRCNLNSYLEKYYQQITQQIVHQLR